MSHVKAALKFLKDDSAETTYSLYRADVNFCSETKHLQGLYGLAEDALEALNSQQSINHIMDGGHYYYIYANFRTYDNGYAWRPSKEDLQKLIDRGY